MSRAEVQSRFRTYDFVYVKIGEMLAKAYQQKISGAAAMAEAQRYAQLMMKTK